MGSRWWIGNQPSCIKQHFNSSSSFPKSSQDDKTKALLVTSINPDLVYLNTALRRKDTHDENRRRIFVRRNVTFNQTDFRRVKVQNGNEGWRCVEDCEWTGGSLTRSETLRKREKSTNVPPRRWNHHIEAYSNIEGSSRYAWSVETSCSLQMLSTEYQSLTSTNFQVSSPCLLDVNLSVISGSLKGQTRWNRKDIERFKGLMAKIRNWQWWNLPSGLMFHDKC